MTAVRAVAVADTGAVPPCPAVTVLATGSSIWTPSETETVVEVVETRTSRPGSRIPALVR
jgi:hypothetical protein